MVSSYFKVPLVATTSVGTGLVLTMLKLKALSAAPPLVTVVSWSPGC